MRTTLVPALIRNLLHNLAHGNRELRLFETAKTYISSGPNSLPIEKDSLAALYYGEKAKTLYREETPDFYVVKGMLDAILQGIGIMDCSYVRSNEPFLHPGRAADIIIGRHKVGFIGAISPSVVAALDIKAQKPSVIVIEMDLSRTISSSKREVVYRPLPKYPFVERDTAVVVNAGLQAAEIIAYLKSYPSDLIEDISIFDVYQGGNIGEGKKSVAFNVRYRSPDRTLTDEEVESLHRSLVEYIMEKTAGQLRI
jgi:phenylalanyl-tRNA synthetase beta chain